MPTNRLKWIHTFGLHILQTVDRHLWKNNYLELDRGSQNESTYYVFLIFMYFLLEAFVLTDTLMKPFSGMFPKG